MSKSRYQTPARLGWGQTALMLHPGLASLGKLGPLGGRLSDKEAREEEEDKMKSKKKKRKKISKEEQQRREEEEEEAKYFSTMDLFLYLGLFLFSGGLVVMILLLPLPNTWLLTESLVQVQYSTVQYSTVQYSTVHSPHRVPGPGGRSGPAARPHHRARQPDCTWTWAGPLSPIKTYPPFTIGPYFSFLWPSF